MSHLQFRRTKFHSCQYYDISKFHHFLIFLDCECARKAEVEGYTHFAIGYYGECHGTKNDTAFFSYARNPSATSNKCIQDIRSKCHKSLDHTISCAGIWGTEYIYSMSEAKTGILF